MKKIQFVIFIGLAIACTRQAPQLPANKSTIKDSVGLAIQSVNQRLIEGEDSILLDYVQKRGLNFVKKASGLWMKTEKKTSGQQPKELEKCKIKYRVYSLTDSLLFEKVETITIAKKQIVNGIEEALRLMNKGEKVILILPWYLAYGMNGDGEKVPPYTSVVVHLQLLK